MNTALFHLDYHNDLREKYFFLMLAGNRYMFNLILLKSSKLEGLVANAFSPEDESAVQTILHVVFIS